MSASSLRRQPPPPAPTAPPDAGPPGGAAPADPARDAVPTDRAADAVPDGVRLDAQTTLRFENGELVISDPSGATTSLTLDAAQLIPPQVPELLGISFAGLVAIILAVPIGRAIARWIDRRAQVPAVDPQLATRLVAIEQAVDTVAIEMERLSEAHRFTTRLLTERIGAPDFAAGARALHAPDAGAPVPAALAREAHAPATAPPPAATPRP
jgi:hypothetical protein